MSPESQNKCVLAKVHCNGHLSAAKVPFSNAIFSGMKSFCSVLFGRALPHNRGRSICEKLPIWCEDHELRDAHSFVFLTHLVTISTISVTVEKEGVR